MPTGAGMIHALAAVSNKVFMIAGYVYVTGYSSTVSCYDIASDTWEGLNAKLNIARSGHSACALKKMIYVFSGCNGDYKRLNSIEVISETSLVQNFTSTWKIIEVPTKILISREPTVAPINETDIAIMGGHYASGRYLSHVVLFGLNYKSKYLSSTQQRSNSRK